MPRFDNLSAETIRRIIEQMDHIDAIDDDMRALVEKRWPWLQTKQ